MKTIVYVNFALTLLLIGVLTWFFAFQKTKTTSTIEPVTNVVETTSNKYIDECGDTCKKEIADNISVALSTISATPKEVTKTVSTQTATVKAKMQTAYIPIAGPITTTSQEWYDAPGTEFYLDFNRDYGKTAYANWEASLKVADGNGQVFARIYDITNKIAVNGSEISISNNGDLTQAISGGLSFWAGNNQYRIQLKSLNTFAVTFGSGRIKIIY